MTCVCAYAAQAYAGRSAEEKDSFWDQLISVTRSIPASELIVVGGDLNGHVGTNFFIDKIAGVQVSTDAAGNPAFRHLPEDVALNLFQPVDQEEVISLITSLPNKQCRSDPLPTWLLKECSVELAPFIC